MISRNVCRALAFAVALASSVDAVAQTDAAPSSTVATSAPQIHLACDGVGTYPEGSNASAFAFANNGRSVSAGGMEVHRGQVETEVFVDVVGDSGRIKLPGIMIPPIHTHDDNGWRPIADLRITDAEIAGKFEVNFLNKPTVSINRVTGHIDVGGNFKLSFSGECRPYDAGARKF